MNRALNCVVRPSRFDLEKEQEIEPVSGYGIIPLLMAAGSIAGGLLEGKAKKKQAKYDAKVAAAEAQRRAEATQIAAKKRQTMLIVSVLGILTVGAIIKWKK